MSKATEVEQKHGIEWAEAERGLRSEGYASLGRLLDAEQCRGLISLYADESRFRSRTVMERFHYGRGEYQYLAYPLPAIVATLRARLYAGLAPIAGRWMGSLGKPSEYPADHEAFLDQCRAAGQLRPTPLILKYGAGDFNRLHQDLYGDVVFPFQVIFCLSRPQVDFEGGELMLVEQQPRAQSVGRVIPLAHGEAVAITTRYRPVEGKRGFVRTNVRHGVSPLRSGERYTMGVIFHDAV
ncbi:MAG: 2OG-Fe(II) oxygenase [Bryobacteraceae bacterium]